MNKHNIVFFLRFDNSGAGACMKRYSDPSYFKRASASSEPVKAEKIQRKKKVSHFGLLHLVDLLNA